MVSDRLQQWCKEKNIDPNSPEVGKHLIIEINKLKEKILQLTGRND